MIRFSHGIFTDLSVLHKLLGDLLAVARRRLTVRRKGGEDVVRLVCWLDVARSIFETFQVANIAVLGECSLIRAIVATAVDTQDIRGHLQQTFLLLRSSYGVLTALFFWRQSCNESVRWLWQPKLLVQPPVWLFALLSMWLENRDGLVILELLLKFLNRCNAGNFLLRQTWSWSSSLALFRRENLLKPILHRVCLINEANSEATFRRCSIGSAGKLLLLKLAYDNFLRVSAREVMGRPLIKHDVYTWLASLKSCSAR